MSENRTNGDNTGANKSSAARDTNFLTVVGNIGVAAEYQHREGQTPYCVFKLAVSGGLLKGKERSTLWYRVIVWGKLAERVVKYGLKSQQVLVAGDFTINEWTDREGGTRYQAEITAERFQLLGDPMTALRKESERLEELETACERESRG